MFQLYHKIMHLINWLQSVRARALSVSWTVSGEEGASHFKNSSIKHPLSSEGAYVNLYLYNYIMFTQASLRLTRMSLLRMLRMPQAIAVTRTHYLTRFGVRPKWMGWR